MTESGRFIFLLTVAAALADVLAGCRSGSDAAAAADPCEELRGCCDSMGSAAEICREQASQAASVGGGQAGTACADLLMSYARTGLCKGQGASAIDGGPANAPDAGAGADANGESPVCARYLACIGAVSPATLPGILAAYGPEGSCWSGGAALADTCTTACATGIAQMREASPSETVCALCASDAECVGKAGGPACSIAQGHCVACTQDAHCTSSAAPHCDAGGNRCVACVTDAQCTTASAPHCDARAGACVGCTQGAQCASGSCQGGTCCVPTTCDERRYDCGAVFDGCGGQASCGGACALGTCTDNVCTTLGKACTPGTLGQCVPGEKCMPDGWHQDYRCSPTSVDGAACTELPTDTCDVYAVGGEPVDDYTCVKGHCAQNCLTGADCAASKTCTPFLGNPITAQLPGQCL